MISTIVLWWIMANGKPLVGPPKTAARFPAGDGCNTYTCADEACSAAMMTTVACLPKGAAHWEPDTVAIGGPCDTGDASIRATSTGALVVSSRSSPCP